MASSAAKAKRFRLDCRHAVQPGVEADAGPRISRMPSRAQGDSGRSRAIRGPSGGQSGAMASLAANTPSMRASATGSSRIAEPAAVAQRSPLAR
jgi:hypothetical protein